MNATQVSAKIEEAWPEMVRENKLNRQEVIRGWIQESIDEALKNQVVWIAFVVIENRGNWDTTVDRFAFQINGGSYESAYQEAIETALKMRHGFLLKHIEVKRLQLC